jgi:hypothetical protein
MSNSKAKRLQSKTVLDRIHHFSDFGIKWIYLTTPLFSPIFERNSRVLVNEKLYNFWESGINDYTVPPTTNLIGVLAMNVVLLVLILVALCSFVPTAVRCLNRYMEIGLLKNKWRIASAGCQLSGLARYSGEDVRKRIGFLNQILREIGAGTCTFDDLGIRMDLFMDTVKCLKEILRRVIQRTLKESTFCEHLISVYEKLLKATMALLQPLARCILDWSARQSVQALASM